MAMGAMKIRKGLDITDQLSMTEETVKELLEPVRNEDKGDDLWSVFNVLQEKVIKGQFYFSNGKNKARKQRGITSIKKDLDINTKLFGLANNYLMAA
jgi:Mor family transcriptional regulator